MWGKKNWAADSSKNAADIDLCLIHQITSQDCTSYLMKMKKAYFTCCSYCVYVVYATCMACSQYILAFYLSQKHDTCISKSETPGPPKRGNIVILWGKEQKHRICKISKYLSHGHMLTPYVLHYTAAGFLIFLAPNIVFLYTQQIGSSGIVTSSCNCKVEKSGTILWKRK